MRDFIHLYTHDGMFHADEVLATAMLTCIAEVYEVVRGGDDTVPSGKDWIVYDVGGGALDHHTPENKLNNGFHPGTEIPYAACGLVWRKYYREILEEEECPERYMDTVFTRIENTLVLGVDAFDNGVNPVGDALKKIVNVPEEEKKEVLVQSRNAFTFSQMIKDFNPTWNSERDHNEAFMDAVSFAKDIFLNRLDSIISSLDAKDYVQQCINYSGGHIMTMDPFAPWEGILYSQSYDPKANDVWYVVSPALRGGWNIQCALIDNDDRTSYRHPLPKSWYGLRGEELQKESGISTAIFCHPSGFLAGAQTQEDALALAQLAASLPIE